MANRRKVRKGPVVLLVAIICVLIAVIIALAFWMHNQIQNPGSATAPHSSVPASSGEGSSSKPSSISSSSVGIPASDLALGGLMMLVNKEHALPESYTPNFVTIPSKYYYTSDKDRNFDERAAPYLEKFIDDAAKAGFDLKIYSGYRSYSYQQSNFNRHVSQNEASGETSAQASSDAATIVAPPGTSEHETGLAADIITSDWISNTKLNPTGDLNAGFDKTAAFSWMIAHCADYGFILRYPKDKVQETQYDYEPWHYRFVGVDYAKKIVQSGLSLEEYEQQNK